MKAYLSRMIVAAAAIGLLSTAALGQGAAGLDQQDNAAPMMPRMDNPLGDFDLALAGETEESRRAYIMGLSEDQRNELKDRCGEFPLNPAVNVDQSVKDFCATLDIFFQESINRP